MTAPLRHIVIAGGGTAGWMTAALLSRRLAPLGISITLIESSDIGTVGVGEATTPAIRDFLAEAGIDEAAVIVATNATAKLGIAFDGWAGSGSRFFHPFGLYGSASNGVAFHQYWLRQRATGDATPLGRYCLATQLAEAGRMAQPVRPAPDYAFHDWALHFDAALFAAHLRQVCEGRGVRRVDARIKSVERCATSGRITALDTLEAGHVPGDLFFDCTGFASLLIGGELGEPFEDWADLLPVDRAIAIPCTAARPDAIEPFTRATAMPAGWRWRIPLRNRIGNGHVYCSRYRSDDEALAELQATLEGAPLAEPRMLRFTTGRRRRAWVDNCIAVGLAAGFLEPLESTSITLIHSAVQRALAFLPAREIDPALRDEFNRITSLEYERIRDFLILHYWGNGRGDGEPFWRDRRNTPLPDMLAYKVRLFRARGEMARAPWETFADPSWLSVFAGLGILPDATSPLADAFTVEQVESAFGRIRGDIDRLVAGAKPHRGWLEAAMGAAGQGATVPSANVQRPGSAGQIRSSL